jgi:hypothetical protein
MGRCILLILFAISIYYKSPAQGNTPTLDQINHFRETTTLVVLDGRDVAFDAMLSESCRKYWTITPYEIINVERYEKMKTNSAFSFLVLTQTVFDKDKVETQYGFLNLILAHPTGDINQMPVIAYIPFSGDQTTINQHIYKTGLLIKAIQFQANQIIQNPNSVKKRLSWYNRNIPNLKGKTLLIATNDLQSTANDSSILRKSFKNNLKLLSVDKIEKLVISGSESFVTLHIVAPPEGSINGRCFKMLIDVKDGSIYYYSENRISSRNPGKFLRKDIRKIK